jgi:MoaA/NifB/PqqE/SkfB family radical SAM enzyme
VEGLFVESIKQSVCFLSRESADYTHFLSRGSVNCVLYNIHDRKVLHCKNSVFTKIIEKDVHRLPKNVVDEIGVTYTLHTIEEEEPFIRKILIQLTDDCNYYCKSCYSSAYNCCKKERTQMSDTVIDTLSNLIDKTRPQTVCLLGGEPFLHTQLLDIVNHFECDNIKINLFTNGSFLSNFWLCVLKEKNVVLRLTLYSLSRELHDSYTGIAGSFDNVLSWMRKLNSANIKVKMAFILSYDDYIIYRDNPYSLVPESVDRYVDIVRPAENETAGKKIAYINQWKELNGKQFRPLTSVGRDMIINNIFRHSCYGYEVTIDVDGKIFACPWIAKGHGNILSCSELPVRGRPLREQYEICSHCEFSFMCHDCTYINNLLGENRTKPLLCQYNPLTGAYEDDESFELQANISCTYNKM